MTVDRRSVADALRVLRHDSLRFRGHEHLHVLVLALATANRHRILPLERW